MRVALGVGLLWGAYAIGFYGYCLIKSYDVNLAQLLKPTNQWVGQGQEAQITANAYTWPPGVGSDSLVFPTGNSGMATPKGSGAVG